MPNNEQASCLSPLQSSPFLLPVSVCLDWSLMPQNNVLKKSVYGKCLGASVSEIVAMISKDFVKLVLIGFPIAFPVPGG